MNEKKREQDILNVLKSEREITLDGIRDVKLYQNKSGYRFSVDALLLSSFVHIKHVESLADLGAGSGIIGLLLAKKYHGARVALVELQESLASLAKRNVELNGLQGRVRVISADIKEIRNVLKPLSCDIVVSNPPFRKPESGRLSEGEEKAVARHEIRLGLSDLAEAASFLLRARGRFFMIYHPERLLELIDTLRRNRLEPKRIRFVHNDPGSVSKIILVEAVKEGRAGVKIEKPLFIYKSEGVYTDEVERMYGR
jgi:tRNA1Val (adenine37-N6)-methyltransferase